MADESALREANGLYQSACDLQEEIDAEATAMARVLRDAQQALDALDSLRLVLLEQADHLTAASGERRAWEHKALDVLQALKKLQQETAVVGGPFDTATRTVYDLDLDAEIRSPASVAETPEMEHDVAVEAQFAGETEEQTLWWDRFAESEKLFEEQLYEALSLVEEAREITVEISPEAKPKPAEKKREQAKT